MKKVYLFIIITIIYCLSIALAQSPEIEWQNTIGGYETDFCRSIKQTDDGGYIVGGTSDSYTYSDKAVDTRGKYDLWVLKIDAIGNIEWQRTLGGSENEEFASIEQTIDGGYILGGSSLSNISGEKTENNKGANDYWILKLDNLGNIEWQETIGGQNQDWLYSIEQITDGGYILGGSSMSDISGDKTEDNLGVPYSTDIWIVKLDAIGNIQWQNTIGGRNDEGLASILQTEEGGFIIGGMSNSIISSDKTEDSKGEKDFWIVKLDAVGNIEWQKTIGGQNHDQLTSIEQTTDDGYILGGYSASNISGDKSENSDGWDYWVVKLDKNGSINWENTIVGDRADELNSIHQTIDGGYILGGKSTSGISGDKTENNKGWNDYWVIKLDINGNIIWQKVIGGNATDDLQDLQQTNDGGFILAGFSQSEISGDKTENSQGGGDFDYWIVKLGPDLPLSTEINLEYVVSELFSLKSAYPNPFNPKTTIRYGLEIDNQVKIEIYDLSGKLLSTLHNNNQTQGWHSVIWNGTNQKGKQMPAGLYLSKITVGNESKTTKMMLLK